MKRTLFLFFLSVLSCLSAFPQHPRVAVVLSGGGAKGVAHIGALKVIEKAGIPIDIITGTSMGSIIGGLYSCGWNATRLDSMVKKQDWAFLLSDKGDYYAQNLTNRERQTTYAYSKNFTLKKKSRLADAGFIKGDNLMKLFRQLTAGYNDSISFDSLPIPFACVATNIVDNTEYDFHSGVLAEAMRTSMSIPGAFAPVRKGDKVLVDGGLRNNYPADIAKAMGADYIIGVTVQGPPRTADDLTSGASVLGQIVDVNCKNKYADNLAITDIPIRVNTQGYGAASFTPAAIDTLERRGEEEALKHWDELLALKTKLGLDKDYHPTPHTLNPNALKPVDYSDNTDRKRPETDMARGSVGLRFDTEEMVAMQLDGIYSMSKHPFDFEATLRLGKNIHTLLQAMWTLRHGMVAKAAYGYQHNDVDIYRDGTKNYNLTLNHHQGAIGITGIGIRNMEMDVSARWDYYNYHHLMVASQLGHESFKMGDDHFFSYHVNLHYNSENQGLFPTRGSKFMAEYAYFTDNFYQYNDHKGFSEVSSLWRTSFAFNHWLTFQPMFYGRLLFGSEIPPIRSNIIGGQWFAHYFEQQMPFTGIGNIETTDNQFVACQLKFQAQLTDNNFVLLKAVGAEHANKLRDIFDNGPMLGWQAAYYYRTIFGPVGATLGYTNKTDKFNFFVNLGFEF